MSETTAMPPEPPVLDLERRHAHLLAEIAVTSTRKTRPIRFLPLGRRVAFVVLALTALTAAGAAFAVGPGDFSRFFTFFDQANDPSIPRLVGDRAVVTRGDDWAYVTWKSTRGLCTSIVIGGSDGDRDGGVSCGMPVVGAPATPGSRQHLVVGGLMQRRPDEPLWIDGVTAANVSRVDVELADGSRLQAHLYDAPAALGLDLKFFITQTRFQMETSPQAPNPLYPVAAFNAYDGNGRLLERFSMTSF